MGDAGSCLLIKVLDSFNDKDPLLQSGLLLTLVWEW